MCVFSLFLVAIFSIYYCIDILKFYQCKGTQNCYDWFEYINKEFFLFLAITLIV
ncbi:hypothetical protein C2G38_2073669 [Gigaspora rosea]|uniref:Uncharacterized protein n=1 Tax=Gigaspora rosea TaxID=44941 RepID=A0A397VQ20_9GLOM|nr:hypothetical protein C2G38_2073669 [Gigaspora rosea]